MTEEHRFLWMDLETTGLITGLGGLFNGGALLEWALVLAADGPGGDMSPVRQFQAVIHHDVNTLQMDPFVLNMHTNNGLLAEVATSTTTLEESDEFLANLCLTEFKAKPRSLTIAGNSVGQLDYPWICQKLPQFAKFLHHRVFDVSTLQRAHEEWRGTEPIRGTAHRALDDIYQSLKACKAWREQAGI